LNCAVATQDEKVTLYSISDLIIKKLSDPRLSDRLCSSSKEHILKYIRRHAKELGIEKSECEKFVQTHSIEGRSLQSICKEFNLSRISLLQVDTEGYDFEIIKQIDNLPERPIAINYEHKHLSKRDRNLAWDFLVSRSYKLSIHGLDSGDTFAIRELT
jgi:FkbM family methyltransferase